MIKKNLIKVEIEGNILPRRPVEKPTVNIMLTGERLNPSPPPALETGKFL